MGFSKTLFYSLQDINLKSLNKVSPNSKTTGVEGNQVLVSIRNGSDSTWSMVDETVVFSFLTRKVSAGTLGKRFFEEMIIEENGNVNTFLSVYSDDSTSFMTTDSKQVYYAVSGSQDYATATIEFATKESGQKVRTVVLERGDDDNSSHDSDCDSKAHDDDKKKNHGSFGMSMGLLRSLFD